MKKLCKNQKGFTLVEVLIVLVILAILAAILIPALTGYVDKADKDACLVVRGQLRRGVMASYRLEPGITAAELAAELEENYGVKYDSTSKKYTGACPSGGGYTITIDDKNNTFNVACDKHGGYVSGTDVLLNNRYEFDFQAISDWLHQPGRWSNYATVDSTGQNKGAPIKNDLKKKLALDEGQDFDFCIEHTANDEQYYTIYIFDIPDTAEYTYNSVNAAAKKPTIEVTRYIWDFKNNKVKEGTEDETGTVKLKTKTDAGQMVVIDATTFVKD